MVLIVKKWVIGSHTRILRNPHKFSFRRWVEEVQIDSFRMVMRTHLPFVPRAAFAKCAGRAVSTRAGKKKRRRIPHGQVGTSENCKRQIGRSVHALTFVAIMAHLEYEKSDNYMLRLAWPYFEFLGYRHSMYDVLVLRRSREGK